MIVLLSCSLATAQQKSQEAQKAIVAKNGVAIYKVPNFDAPVVARVRKGKKVLASKKIYKGIGGFGSFYKVKLKSGKVGYISDINLVTEFQSGKADSSQDSQRQNTSESQDKNPRFQKVEDAKQGRRKIFYTRYMGATFGSVELKEKIQGNTLSAPTQFFGFKMTGPGVLLEAAPMDFHFSFRQGGPAYYEKFASTPATGFMIQTDVLFHFPLIQWQNAMFSYGFGPTLHYRDLRVQISHSFFDDKALELGGVLTAGYAHRWGRYAARLETRYYYEHQSYTGYWASLQVAYR